jgi:hypothetical protein
MVLSLTLYIVLVIGGVLLLSIMALVLGLMIHFGKPMRLFFDARIKSWKNERFAIFEIFTLTNNLVLELAHQELGHGFRRFVETPKQVREPFSKKTKWTVMITTFLALLLTGIISAFQTSIPTWLYYLSFVASLLMMICAVSYLYVGMKRPPIMTTSSTPASPLILPKSVYSVNGVTTIPLLDIHPCLHPDIIKGLEQLIREDITTFTQLEENAKGNNRDISLFGDYTYRTFYELYSAARKKFELDVKVTDVVNFLEDFDKNFRESIESKNFNQTVKSKTDNKYAVYGWISLLIIALAIAFKFIWLTTHAGVKP